MNYDVVYNALETWLNANRPDYNEGLAILMSYEDKPALCTQLQQYKNPQKLYESLEKLFEKVKAKRTNPIHEKKEVRQILNEVKKNPEAVPADKVLRDLHMQGISCMKEIDSVKGTLYMLGRNPANEQTMPLSDEIIKQRLAVAKILAGDGGLNDKWTRINAMKDYYQRTGEMPLVAEAKNENVITGDLYRAKENCRKQISKLKGKIETAKKDLVTSIGADRTDLLTNLNIWEAKLKVEEGKMEQIKAKENVEST